MSEAKECPETRSVELVGSGDEVLEEIFRTQYRALVGLARLLGDDRESAEEIVQEAFVRTYAAWPRLRDHSNPVGYLRTVVVNLARGNHRRRVLVRRTHLRPVPDAPSAETTVIRDEQHAHIARAVQDLPRRQRECVVLRYFLDCSTAETARTLSISEGAVKSHLHRALAALGIEMEAQQ